VVLASKLKKQSAELKKQNHDALNMGAGKTAFRPTVTRASETDCFFNWDHPTQQTKHVLETDMKKLIGLMVSTWILLLTTTAYGVVEVDDELRLQMAEQVINELGFYDAMEVEKRSRLHLLTLEGLDVPGKSQGGGNCKSSSCLPTTLPFTYPVPKAKVIQGPTVNGSNLPNVRLKFSGRNSAHTAETEAGLKGFYFRIVQNGLTYEDYYVDLIRAADGGIPKNQFLRIKNLTPAAYNIHMASVYNINGSQSVTDYVSFKQMVVVAFNDTVSELTDLPLKNCVLGNGYGQNTEIKTITHLDCSNTGLTDASLVEMKNKFIGVRYLNLSNNSQLTTWGSLSNMVQMSWIDLSHNPQMYAGGPAVAGDLDSIVLSHMNLSAVEGVPYNASYADLSHNNIDTGYDQLKLSARSEGLAALNLSHNPVVSSADPTGFKTSISGQFIDAIDLSHTDIKDVNDLAGINGLKHVNLNNALQLNNTQDISQFSGFCGFSMNETAVRQFRGTYKPIQFLSMTNNPNLDRVQALNQNPEVQTNYWPMRVDLTGSNALKCDNYYNFIDATTEPGAWPLLSDVALVSNEPQCPTVNWPGVFNHAEYCKPNKINQIQVLEDQQSSQRFITWLRLTPEQYQTRGITQHKISTYLNDQILNVHYQAVEDGGVFIDNDLTPNKYIIQDCTDQTCGYEGVAHGPFGTGLAAVENITQSWNTAGTEVTFAFSYPQSSFTGMGEPDYFMVVPNFSQPVGTPDILPTDVTPGLYEGTWYSSPILVDQYIGSTYEILACNSELGCGGSTYVALERPAPAMSIDPLQGVTASVSDNLISLSWNANALDENADYIEVEETQPQMKVGHKATAGALNTNGLSHTTNTLYTDHLDQPLLLERAVNGHYTFILRACHRDRENGDVCSAGSTVNETVANTHPVEDYPNEIDIFNGALTIGTSWYNSQNDYWNGAPNDINHDWRKSHYLFFKSKNGPNNSRSPDYFYFEKIASTHPSATCVQKYHPEGDSSQPAEFKKLNSFIVQNERQSYQQWSYKTCHFPRLIGTWAISACFTGIGCGDAVSIDLGTGDIETLDINNPDNYQIKPSEMDVSDRTNEPRSPITTVDPGLYWDHRQSGTGWQFHWATHLDGEPGQQADFRTTYDLVAYWFAYSRKQQFEGGSSNYIWTPTWFKAELKQQGNTDFYQGQLKKVKKDGSYYIETNTGEIEINLESIDPGNSRMTVKLNVAALNGITSLLDTSDYDIPCENTDGDINGYCEFDLENFTILGVDGGLDGNTYVERFGYGNDSDHYSGVWANGWNETDSVAEHSIITTINRGLEVSWVATFDDLGEPIWAVTQSCGETCNRPDEQYFDDYLGHGNKNLMTIGTGFNPLKYTSEGFWDLQNNPVYIGNIGRCFNVADDFNQGRFFLEMNITDDEVPGRDAVFTVGNDLQRTCSGTQTTLAAMEKIAGNHYIGYSLNDSNNANITDPNYVGPLVCDPNSPSGLGTCRLTFNWFTSGSYSEIQPFYSVNGVDYSPLLEGDLCSNSEPENTSNLSVTNYICDVNGRIAETTYFFDLRKLKYGQNIDATNPENWISIANTEEISVLDCPENSDICETQIIIEYPFQVTEEPTVSGEMGAMISHQPGSGPVPGTAGVSGGAATYNIPLSLPPGRNGMSPEISINYSSKGGNGIMGLGWSISAGSEISRCPKTLAQDEINGNVDYSNKDRLCLDGHRLVLVKVNGNSIDDDGTPGADGSYWSNNAEYRTEVETFTKVIYDATQDSFLVYSKSGRINKYEKLGLSWPKAYERDSYNNIIEYVYTNEQSSNEYLLEEIKYTGIFVTDNDIQSGTRRIEFSYVNRTDQKVTYQAGYKISSTKRLDQINVYYPGQNNLDTLHRRYGFGYSYSKASGRLKLDSVTETAGSVTRTLVENSWSQDIPNSGWSADGKPDYDLYKGFQRPDAVTPVITEAEFSAMVADTTLTQRYSVRGSDLETLSEGNRVLADFDGDGVKEVLVKYTINQPNTNPPVQEEIYELHSYRLKIQDGVKKPELVSRVLVNDSNLLRNRTTVSFQDFNNDGRADLLFERGGTIHIGVWNTAVAVDFTTDNNISAPNDIEDYFIIGNTGIAYEQFQLADFNNDGLTDIILDSFPDNSGVSFIKMYLNELSISGTPSDPVYSPTFNTTPDFTYQMADPGDSLVLDDFNGDAVIDIMIDLWRNEYDPPSLLPYKQLFLLGAINGSTPTYSTNEPTDLGIPNSRTVDEYHLFIDINGDGLRDFLYTELLTRKWNIQINKGGTGTLFEEPIEINYGFGLYDEDCVAGGATPAEKCVPRYVNGLKVVDFDNDGKEEILLPDPSNVIVNHCTQFVDNSIPGDPIHWVACSDPSYYSGSGDIVNTFYNPSNNPSNIRGWDAGVYGYQLFNLDLSSTGEVVATSVDNIDLFHNLYTGKEYFGGDYLGDGLLDMSERIGCPFSLPDGSNNQNFCSRPPELIFIDHPVIVQFIEENYGDKNSSFEDKKALYFAEVENGVPVISKMSSVVPDLLVNVNQPVSDTTTEWSYQPLSFSSQDREEFPLYTISDTNRYVDEDGISGDHFYFNSSMYVVDEMRQSTGLTIVDNNNNTEHIWQSSQFSYEEAVYNNKGRGFQGFRAITVRTIPDSSQPQQNVSDARSVFSQVFPTAGMLESLEVNQMTHFGILPVENAQYHWSESNQSEYVDNGVHYIPLMSVVNKKLDYLDDLSGVFSFNETEQITSGTPCGIDHGYDEFGNVLCEQTITTDTVHVKVDEDNDPNTPLTTETWVSEKTQVTQNLYDTDESNWWLDKITSKNTENSFVETSSFLIDDIFTTPASIEYDLDKSTEVRYFWKAGQVRKLDCQFTAGYDLSSGIDCDTVVDSEELLKTELIYDSFGNVTSSTVSGIADHNASNIQYRSTSTTYNSDNDDPVDSGYFPEEVNNEGLISSAEYHVNTGLVDVQTDPNGISTSFVYDVFGVQTGKTTYANSPDNNLGQSQSNSIRNCDVTLCGTQQLLIDSLLAELNEELSSISNTGFFFKGQKYSVPTLYFIAQDRMEGSHHITSWLDQNGQVVLTKIQHSGEDAYQLILTNPLEQQELMTEPFEVSGTSFTGVSDRTYPFYSFSMYDERGRLVEKYADLGNLTSDGGSNCKRSTLYTTVGGMTEIVVSADCESTDNDTLLMSRSFDSAGKLRQTVDAEQHLTHYWYDAIDLPYIVSDAAGNQIITQYDDLGRKRSIQDPNMGTVDYEYNSFGELVYQQDAEQAQFSVANYMVYDELGRVLDQYANVASDLSPVSTLRSYRDQLGYSNDLLDYQYRYSNFENSNQFELVHLRDFSYDEFARVIREDVSIIDPDLGINGLTEVNARIEHFYYQNHDFLLQTIYSYLPPGDDDLHVGYSVVNQYDIFGSLIEQMDNPRMESIMSIDDFDLRGLPKSRTLYSLQGNQSMVTEFNYYPGTGQVMNITHGDASRNDSLELNYEYDGWGNIISQSQNVDGGTTEATESFQYDLLHRLDYSTVTDQTGSTAVIHNIDYDYDDGGLGNLVVKSDFSNDQKYEQTGNAGPNAITSALVGGVTINYGYDLKGNRVSAGSDTHHYDAHNLLIRSTQDFNSETVDFRYGVNNQRYFKRERSLNQDNYMVDETTLYLGHAFELIFNETTAEFQSKFQLADYLMVTRRANQAFKYHFIQKDRLGSSSQILDQYGNRLALKGYDAFGKPRNGEGWSPMMAPALNFEDEYHLDSTAAIDVTKRGFTDHEHLDNFELIHMNGRMYDFNNGRFLSVDPFIQGTTSQAINPYSYIQNNPLSGIDPTGYQMECAGVFSLNTCPKSQMYNVIEIDDIGSYEGANGSNYFTFSVKSFSDSSSLNSQQQQARDDLSKPGMFDSGVEGDFSDPVLIKDLNREHFSQLEVAKEFFANADKYLGDSVKGAYDYATSDEGIEAMLLGASFATPVIDGYDVLSECAIGGNCGDVLINAVAKKLKFLEKVFCFPPGTLVLMADGSTKAIEDIIVGDMVMGADPELGISIGQFQVQETLQSNTEVLVTIEFEKNEVKGILEATREHPFYVKEKGWVYAEFLKVGDVLISSDYSEVEIIKVNQKFVQTPTYNLTVDTAHTFFVVSNDISVLVHNEDPYRFNSKTNRWHGPDGQFIEPPTSNQMRDWGQTKGWSMTHRTDAGFETWSDENGQKRMKLKPASTQSGLHENSMRDRVTIWDENGQRVDGFNRPVVKKSTTAHAPLKPDANFCR
jgi:RHS repeat-associated protein